MRECGFFDCNCMVGRRAIVHAGSFWDAQSLVVEMEKFHIDKALVYHAMAREYNAAAGNERLMEEISSYPQLEPVWVVMPHHTGEFYAPDVLVKDLKQNRVRAVRMFPGPKDHNYILSEWNCGELFTALEKHRTVLFIGQDQLTSWNEIHEICMSHPNLKVVLTDLSYRVNRNIYPLLTRHSNLYLETSGYKVNCGIEEIVKRFGSGRLLFGSGLPVYSAAAAVALVNYAEVDETIRRSIAGRNLERLLEGDGNG